ncbi:MAG TPA: TSUP family transporter [Steroidobacteraceae bacterium]|nr:TSUP family transporter [Steroidobacteraceae bacterium]
MIHSLHIYLVITAAFAAGCIDAIVGGGGLIQLPALFGVYPDTMPATLLGTNKFASVFGTGNAVWHYSRRVQIPWRMLLPLIVTVLVTAAAGAMLATHISAYNYRPLVPVLLTLVLILVLRNRALGTTHRPREFARRHHLIAAALIAVVGFYDGFFGPGTGSLFMFVFVRLYGYDFINAAACARVLNVATNLAAITWFVTTMHVMWLLAAGMAISNVAGSTLGARLAMRGGNVLIRNVFILIVIALIIRTLWVVI